MTDPTESQYGSARQFSFPMRVDSGDHGNIYFSEKFYESDDPRFDAIVMIGAIFGHDTDNQDVINSFMYRGVTKRGKAINRIFLRSIAFTFSDPSYLDIEAGNDYTRIDGAITTTDHGESHMPGLGEEGVLAALSETTGYNLSGTDLRTWIHILRSPLYYTFDYLEITYPIGFYHRTTQYGETEKSAWIHVQIMAYIRFFGREKANSKYLRGIKTGSSPE